MVRLVCIFNVVAILTLPARAADADPPFPYTAYIQSSSTSVLSGPNVSFYATDRLKQGDRVEVYRHDAEWAAIRPPAGSFSWVSVDDVRDAGATDIVQVAVAGATSRIGSRFNDQRSVESVQLEVDEPLEVLGQHVFRDELTGESERYYKIAPPAGEFRWVRRSVLGSLPPSDPPEPRTARPENGVRPPDIDANISASADREGWSAPAARSASSGASAADNIQLAGAEEPESQVVLADEPPRSAARSLNELTQPPAQPRPTFDEVVRHPSTLVDEPALFPESTATPGQITTLTRIDGPPTNQRTPMVRTIPTEIPAEDGGAQVQPAQWPSYDMSPRTSMDVISQRASSAWREVDRFRPAYVASLPSAPAASPLSSPPAQSRTRNAPPARTASSVGILPLPPPPSTRPISSDYLDEELAEIDLKLAEIVLQAPETWSLSTLRVRTQAVIDASSDAHIRGAAQKLLVKITQFDDVQRRHRQIVADGRKSPGLAPDMAPTGLPSPAAPTTLAGVNYDGAGWLMPVYTNRRDIPRYVLTDERGNVLQFVTPQPGLNLRNFERQKIGIYGQQSRVPTLDHPHLMAERIVTLDIATRR